MTQLPRDQPTRRRQSLGVVALQALGVLELRLRDPAGLIRYTRGQLTVVDRNRLEKSACECYGVVRREFERLLQA